MPNTKRSFNSGASREAVAMARDAENQAITAGGAAIEAFKEYARERPEIVTMWAFGLGFVLGWKLRIF
jgi:hypothetical protein